MGFNIYHCRDEKSELYEYQIYGKLENCPPDQCADVYIDLHYRVKLNELEVLFLKELHEDISDGRTVIHWEIKFLFLLTNRDYVFIQLPYFIQNKEVDGQKIYVILVKSANSSKFPRKTRIFKGKGFPLTLSLVESDSEGWCSSSFLSQRTANLILLGLQRLISFCLIYNTELDTFGLYTKGLSINSVNVICI
uniref:Uncharacterized protein n=1 Tax=Anolis carolinensis TaxID=28377 RepID=A0A803SYA9_ANOCA